MDKALSTLDWSLIQSFLAVGETGSLSAAARSLGASQPTLSRQVRAMEAAIGADLFVRKPRGLELSESGRALFEAARAMGDAAARLRRTADGQTEELRGTVRITSSDAVALWHLPSILARLRREEPLIDVEVVPSDESRSLLYREADIAVRMFRPTQLDLVTRYLGEIELGVFAAKSYLAGRPAPTDLAAGEAHDWVGFDADTQIIDGMRAAGMEVDRSFFGTRCDHNGTYWALVRAGCGIGFGQVAVARQCPDVERIPVDFDLPSLPVWLAAPEAIRQTPRISRVWDMLAEGLAPLMA